MDREEAFCADFAEWARELQRGPVTWTGKRSAPGPRVGAGRPASTGPGHVDREEAVRDGSGAGQVVASTGPGHVDREEGVGDSRPSVRTVASTGPGHVDREEGSCWSMTCGGSPRFNGARSRGPGRGPTAGDAGPEGEDASTGPGHVDREEAQRPTLRPRWTRCFNGARSRGPGRGCRSVGTAR